MSVQAYPLPPNFNVGEQELFFKKIRAEMSERDNNIEIQGRGEATAARLTLSIDEGWSLQHLNSGKYVLK